MKITDLNPGDIVYFRTNSLTGYYSHEIKVRIVRVDLESMSDDIMEDQVTITYDLDSLDFYNLPDFQCFTHPWKNIKVRQPTELEMIYDQLDQDLNKDDRNDQTKTTMAHKYQERMKEKQKKLVDELRTLPYGRF